MADKKFIPDSDSNFAHMARNFALQITRDPARYLLSADDANIITRAVQAFRDWLYSCCAWHGEPLLTSSRIDVRRLPHRISYVLIKGIIQ